MVSMRELLERLSCSKVCVRLGYVWEKWVLGASFDLTGLFSGNPVSSPLAFLKFLLKSFYNYTSLIICTIYKPLSDWRKD